MDIFDQTLLNSSYYLDAYQSSKYSSVIPLINATQIIHSTIELVKTKQFRFSPPTPKLVLKPSGSRTFYKYELKDYLVLTMITHILKENIQPNFSPNLYSYIKGRSRHQLINKFLNYLSKNGELWIVKSDLTNYSGSIPLNENSHIWQCIESCLSKADLDSSNYLYLKRLIHDFFEINCLDKGAVKKGLPIGSPFCNFLANLYLAELDYELEHQNLFYGRYGDDIILATPSLQIIQEHENRMLNKFQKLALEKNQDKYKRYYYTAGGHYSRLDSSFRGINCFKYLGYIIHANGKIQLPGALTRRFLKKCGHIINELKNTGPKDDLANYICHHLKKRILCIDGFECNSKTIENSNCFLRVSDHHFLFETDKKIALLVSQAVTDIPGIKSFRYLSYKAIRNDHGLPSLFDLIREFYRKKIPC